MACPYFSPREPLPWSKWPGKLRPPLGELYAGECQAVSEPFLPSERLLVDCCNLGYAGTECGRFPSGEAPEAVRFCVSADDGQTVEIDFAVERGHLPFLHGRLRYCRASKKLVQKWPTEKKLPHISHLAAGKTGSEKSGLGGSNSGSNSDTLLEHLAQAFLASYLRSRGEKPVLR